MLICTTSKNQHNLDQVIEILNSHFGRLLIDTGDGEGEYMPDIKWKADVTIRRFADGEILPTFDQSISDHDLVIIGSTEQPHDNIFEIVLIADAARRSGARRIILISPYFGYSRSI
jgi:hypothetical protein